jgi:hypothetical protein
MVKQEKKMVSRGRQGHGDYIKKYFCCDFPLRALWLCVIQLSSIAYNPFELLTFPALQKISCVSFTKLKR